MIIIENEIVYNPVWEFTADVLINFYDERIGRGISVYRFNESFSTTTYTHMYLL